MRIMHKRGFEGSQATLYRRLRASGHRSVNRISDDLTVQHKDVRVEFCDQQMKLIAADPEHHHRYSFSDEASFSMQARRIQVQDKNILIWYQNCLVCVDFSKFNILQKIVYVKLKDWLAWEEIT